MKYTVAHSVIDTLVNYGVEVVYGVPGGANSPLTDALSDRSLRYVNASHECGAVFMAMGYARASGKPVAIFTTAGPGVTNALTGLVSAGYERLPVVLVAGEVSTQSFGKGAVQESNENFNACATVAPVTRFSRMIYRADSAAAITATALEHATGEHPGPVYIAVPFDIGVSECKPAEIARGTVAAPQSVDARACNKVAELLEHAKRPLILAGAGCRGSRDSLTALAENWGIPVATTPKGKGVIDEDHPNALGVVGLGGHPSANEPLTDGIDVLLAMGTSLSDLATNSWTSDLRPSGSMVHVNADASVIGRSYQTDIAIVGPVETFCTELLSRSPVRTQRGTFSGRQVHAPSDYSGRLDGPMVASLVDRYAPNDAVFTADMGEHLVCAIHHLSIKQQRDWFISLGFGAMGSGPCSAVGLQMALPNRRVFALTGDGGFLMLNEITTAVLENVPLTYVVFNDGRLNMVHHGQQGIFGRTQEFPIGEIDYAAYARSVGAHGVVVTTGGQLGDALHGPAPVDRPLVIDARIDPMVRVPATIDRAKGLRATLQGAH